GARPARPTRLARLYARFRARHVAGTRGRTPSRAAHDRLADSRTSCPRRNGRGTGPDLYPRTASRYLLDDRDRRPRLFPKRSRVLSAGLLLEGAAWTSRPRHDHRPIHRILGRPVYL